MARKAKATPEEAPAVAAEPSGLPARVAALEAELQAADELAALLEDRIAVLEVQLETAEASEGGPVAVRFTETAHIQGVGVVSAGMIARNPPRDWLFVAPHVLVSAKEAEGARVFDVPAVTATPLPREPSRADAKPALEI